MDNVLFSHSSDEWRTPYLFFNLLDLKYHFKIDVASDDNNFLCENHFTKNDDGLTKSWVTDGYVYCNPPYSDIKSWTKKAYEEYCKGAKIVMLIPARTDAKYFHEYIYHKAKLEFIQGRLKFEDENGKEHGSAPFPSMLCIYD